MNFIDQFVGKLDNRKVIVSVDGCDFNLGRKPIVRFGIGNQAEICSRDDTEFNAGRVGKVWYLNGPFTEGAIVSKPQSIRRLEGIARRL